MTAYQVLPSLLPAEYDALRADIKAHGVRVPVDQDENGQVLDGHHRSLIAAELGIDCPRRLVPGLSEAQKVAHAIAVNAHRRHLTQQQKRDLLAASIKTDPEASDREHARIVGVSKNTAASVRDDLQAAGQIDHLTGRRGADGKTYAPSQPVRPQSPSPAAPPVAGEGPSSPPSEPAQAIAARPTSTDGGEPKPTVPAVEAPPLAGGGAPDLTGCELTHAGYRAKVTALGQTLPVEEWEAQQEPPAPPRQPSAAEKQHRAAEEIERGIRDTNVRVAECVRSLDAQSPGDLFLRGFYPHHDRVVVDGMRLTRERITNAITFLTAVLKETDR